MSFALYLFLTLINQLTTNELNNPGFNTKTEHISLCWAAGKDVVLATTLRPRLAAEILWIHDEAQ